MENQARNQPAATPVSPAGPAAAMPAPAVISPTVITPTAPSVQPSTPPELQSTIQPAAQMPAAPQPVPTVTPGTVVYGQDESFTPPKPSRRVAHFVLPAVAVVIIAAAVAYFYVLPTRMAKTYTSAIKPLYDKQYAQMTAAYNSLALPIFTSDSSSDATDKQNIASLKSISQTAASSLSALSAKNHFKLLLGTSWLHPVFQADSEYQNMKDYIADSQKFLSNYQTLINYVSQLDATIYSSQSQKFFGEDMDGLGTIYSNPNTSDSVADSILQGTASDSQYIVNKLEALTPPNDLKSYNSELLSDLKGVHNGSQSFADDIQSHNLGGAVLAAATLNDALNKFNDIPDNPTAHIQSDSSLHTQYTALKADNPLQ